MKLKDVEEKAPFNLANLKSNFIEIEMFIPFCVQNDSIFPRNTKRFISYSFIMKMVTYAPQNFSASPERSSLVLC
jgi:hypothetical protein